MTTSAAEHKAGDKEKVEKRRALGRGLESLLPGPRVVQAPRSVAVESTEAAGQQQVPRDARNDNFTPKKGKSRSPLRFGMTLMPGGPAALRDYSCARWPAG